MDDDVPLLHGAAQAVRVGDVTLHGLLAADPGLLPGAGLALEDSHLVAGIDDGVRDGRPDEARRAGDQDLHAGSRSKFCQYLLGVGPFWPWYFEPSSPEPYGLSAGSESWTNESWPIFIA